MCGINGACDFVTSLSGELCPPPPPLPRRSRTWLSGTFLLQQKADPAGWYRNGFGWRKTRRHEWESHMGINCWEWAGLLPPSAHDMSVRLTVCSYKEVHPKWWVKDFFTLCCFECNLWQRELFPVWNHASGDQSAAPLWSAGAREAHPGHLQSLQEPLWAYVSVPASLTSAHLSDSNPPSWLGIRGTAKPGSTGDNQRLTGGATLACSRNPLLGYAANSW